MNYEDIQLIIKDVLQLSTIKYSNMIRSEFEMWAFYTAQRHSVLLENITTNNNIWNWYKNEYRKKARQFFNENKDFFNKDNGKILYEILIIMVEELRTIYPITLINIIKDGKRALK